MRNRAWATDLALFSDMVAKAPTQYLNHFGLARALKERGDLEGALGAYEKGLALKPDDPEMLNNVGNLYRQQSEESSRPEAERRELEAKAEARYRRAIELKPSYSIALNNLGSFYAERKRYDDARVIYEKVLASNPNLWAGHVNLGKIEGLSGHREKAIEHYETALRLNPEMAQRDGVQAELMKLMLESGQLEKARLIALERMEAAGWDKDATDTLLQAYTRTLTLGGEPDAEGLIALRERLAEKYPDLWQNWGSLASLCQATGSLEKAVRYYHRSLETGAQSPWREQIEAALRQIETTQQPR
jgi:Tfp pilus assembly protein PilF